MTRKISGRAGIVVAAIAAMIFSAAPSRAASNYTNYGVYDTTWYLNDGTGIFTNYGTLNILAGGDFQNWDGGTLLNYNTTNVTAGWLWNHGTLTNSGTINVLDSNSDFACFQNANTPTSVRFYNAVITNSGTINLNNSYMRDNCGMLINSGTINLTGGSSRFDWGGQIILNGGTINHLAGIANGNLRIGILTITGGATGYIDERITPLEIGTANLNGTLNVIVFPTAPPGTSSMTIGTLNVAAGETGIITGSAGLRVTTLNLAGTYQNHIGGIWIDNVNVAAGQSGTLAGPQTILMTGGTIAGTLNNNVGLSIQDGTLTNSGTLNNTGNIDMYATFNNTGTINNSGTFTVLNFRTLAVAGTLTNSGTLAINDSATINGAGTMTNSGTINIATTANWNFTGAITLDGGTIANSRAATSISTLNISPGQTGTISGVGSLTITTANLAGTLNNTSTAAMTLTTLNVVAGNNGGLSGSGTTSVGTGNINGTFGVSGTGTLNVTTANLAGTLNNTSTGTTTLTTLNVTAGNTGAIGGSGTTNVTTANLAGTLNSTSAGATTLTNLNIAAGTTGTIGGAGAGAFTVTNAPTINGTLVLNRAVTFTNGINGFAGTLGGSGTITGNLATGAGTLSPGNSPGTINIVGNFTLNSAGTLDLEVENGAADKVAATGNVTFESGSTINVLTSGSSRGTYQVVTAGGTLTDAGAVVNITDDSLMVDYTYAMIQGAGGMMTVTGAGAGGAFERTATNDNRPIARQLDQIGNSHPADMDPMFETLYGMNDAAQVDRAMTQLNGNNIASVSSALGLYGAQQSNTFLRSRFSLMRQSNLAGGFSLGAPAISSGAMASSPISMLAGGAPSVAAAPSASSSKPVYKWNVFAEPYGGFGRQGASADGVGYNFGGTGIMVGGDCAVLNDLRVGVLTGYSYNAAKLHSSMGYVTDNILRVGPYASYTRGGLFFDTAPTVGLHSIETQRNIDFLNTTATGERTAFDFNWFNNAGYQFRLPHEFLLTPSYGLGFTMLHDPSYTETDAAAGANLRVDQYTTWSLLQNLELKLGRLCRINNRFALLPEVWGGWEHEYLNSGRDMSAAFSAMPAHSWTAPISTIPADRAVIGAGLNTLISDNLSIFGRCDQRIWSGGFSTSFTAGFKLEF